MSEQVNERPDDWIPASEAAKLVKSPTGKRTHCSTIVRWALTGKIQSQRRGRYWFVLRHEVLDLMKPFRASRPLDNPRPGLSEATKARLRNLGVHVD